MKEFPATETYSSLDRTEALYKILRLSIVRKKNFINKSIIIFLNLFKNIIKLTA
jgi:hypothetical protein